MLFKRRCSGSSLSHFEPSNSPFQGGFGGSERELIARLPQPLFSSFACGLGTHHINLTSFLSGRSEDRNSIRQNLGIPAHCRDMTRGIPHPKTELPNLEFGQKGDMVRQNGKLSKLTGSHCYIDLFTQDCLFWSDYLQ